MNDFDMQAGRRLPGEPEQDTRQSESDDHDVVTAVQGLAGLVVGTEDVEQTLARIAEFTVASVPGAAGAGVTAVRLRDGTPKVLAWAATAEFVREIDHLQYDICGEGPCLTAMHTRRPLISGSLGSDQRWPRFGGRVARSDVHSALSLPLIVGADVVGALNIYGRERDVFTEYALRLAERFAGPAAVSVHNVQLLHRVQTQAVQLETAMRTRAVIDQAIGILRSRSGGSAEEAFGRLRQLSQAQNVKLAVIAEELVSEAVRRAHARHSKA